MLKSIYHHKDLGSKHIPDHKNNAEGITTPDFKIYCRGIIIKIFRYKQTMVLAQE